MARLLVSRLKYSWYFLTSAQSSILLFRISMIHLCSVRAHSFLSFGYYLFLTYMDWSTFGNIFDASHGGAMCAQAHL